MLFVFIYIYWFPTRILYIYRWGSCRLTVTRRVSHVEQEVQTLSEHLCLPSVFSGIHIARSLVFCVVLCRRLFVQTKVLFLLAIMFSVLRLTASDYPFDINKLYWMAMNIWVWIEYIKQTKYKKQNPENVLKKVGFIWFTKILKLTNCWHDSVLPGGWLY
jgi:hypothetical protein